MPTSTSSQIPLVIKIACELQPDRVLDVGFGFGKYGLLCREYLEMWGSLEKGNRCAPPWRTTIDGIEGHGPYVGDLQRHIYDHVYIGDALDILQGMPDRAYDLALLIDVLEHFEFEVGTQALGEALRASRFVLVSTPRRFHSQGTCYDNPLEIHRSYWTLSALRRIAPTIVVGAWNVLLARRQLVALMSLQSPDELGRWTTLGWLLGKVRKHRRRHCGTL